MPALYDIMHELLPIEIDCQPGFSRFSVTDTGLNRWASRLI